LNNFFTVEQTDEDSGDGVDVVVKVEPTTEEEHARWLAEENVDQITEKERNAAKRRKKIPEGFITQIEWKRQIERNDHPVNGGRDFRTKSPKKLVLSSGAVSLLPRCAEPDPEPIVRDDNELPCNFMFNEQIDALYDPDLTDSDSEDDERKEARLNYERTAVVYPMNAHQLRRVFARSYSASRGMRASLFQTRIGEYCRQLAKRARSIPGEPSEAAFTVIFENCFDLRYESFYREPGKASAPLEKWSEIGAFLPIFNVDCFGHLFVADFRVWVRDLHQKRHVKHLF